MLCLVELRGSGSDADPWRAPDGWDGSGILDLRSIPTVGGQAIAWLPHGRDGAGVTVLGADATERPSRVARRHFVDAPSLGQAIVERIRPRLVCERHGCYCAYVAGRPLVAPWPGRPRHASVSRSETWPTVGTDISTGQNMAWAHLAGTPNVIAGTPNRLRKSDTDIEFTGRSTGATGSADTDDNSVQATVAIAASPTGEDYGILGCRKDDSATDSYYMLLWRRNAGARRLLKRIGGSPTELVNGDADVTGPLVLKVQANGSTIRGWIGTWDSGNVTDTDLPTGKCAVVRPRSLNGANPGPSAEVEIYGDVVLQDLSYGASSEVAAWAVTVAHGRRR